MKKCAAVLTSLIVLTGCQSTPPEADPGSARFNSPEVHSQPFKLKLSLGTDKGRTIPIEGAPLDSNNSESFASAEMSLGGGFSAKHQSGKADKWSIKYQISGQYAETAQAGNISHAIALGYLSDQESGLVENSSNNSPATRKDWKLDHDLIDVSWITGYRLSDELLVYGGAFYQFGEIDGAYYRTVSDGCSESHASECTLSHFSDDGSTYGLSLSIEYAINKHLSYSVEAIRSHSNWFNRKEKDTLVNGKVTYQF
ncbi:outer membrane beta-barrel protein [Pseudoalteromonas umbrosa]|uniref:outer membrane beta-barrel protein n=1 Tax=Pseudoalteromonas umbrosa TaxID=3048489 RepID=UPI0024C41F46|nr:outer membrane beta-barrel protein [Pseudoalteromonas sp. B95]MDK1288686.1 hypothetical protein [Pseudoalteromonas sp. B95]